MASILFVAIKFFLICNSSFCEEDNEPLAKITAARPLVFNLEIICDNQA